MGQKEPKGWAMESKVFKNEKNIIKVGICMSVVDEGESK
jgi:hypothetical protein